MWQGWEQMVDCLTIKPTQIPRQNFVPDTFTGRKVLGGQELESKERCRQGVVAISVCWAIELSVINGVSQLKNDRHDRPEHPADS